MTKRCAQGHPGNLTLLEVGMCRGWWQFPPEEAGMEAFVGSPTAPPTPHSNGRVTLISMAEETGGDEVENPFKRQSVET